MNTRTLIVLIYICFVVAVIGSWITNVVKLTDCDFQAPYKCEVLHGVGIFPPVALVTAWSGTDKAVTK